MIVLMLATIIPVRAQVHFGPQRVITTQARVARSVYAADLDGDDDLDILSASAGDNKIAWYENDGDGGFGSQQVISTQAMAAESVHAADLDGDGDLDVLSASLLDHKIAWYEQLQNRPPVAQAGPDQLITCTAPGGADVPLDGSASSDPHGDALAFS